MILWTECAGIFFTDGPFWKEQRRFFLRYIRDFGFGRRFESLEKHINDELLSFVDVIKNGPKFIHEEVYQIHDFLKEQLTMNTIRNIQSVKFLNIIKFGLLLGYIQKKCILNRYVYVLCTMYYIFKEILKDGMVLCPQIFSANPGNLFLQVLINDRFCRKDLGGLYKYE